MVACAKSLSGTITSPAPTGGSQANGAWTLGGGGEGAGGEEAGGGTAPVTYVEFPETGQMVPVEDPEGLSGAIGDLLRTLDGSFPPSRWRWTLSGVKCSG